MMSPWAGNCLGLALYCFFAGLGLFLTFRLPHLLRRHIRSGFIEVNHFLVRRSRHPFLFWLLTLALFGWLGWMGTTLLYVTIAKPLWDFAKELFT